MRDKTEIPMTLSDARIGLGFLQKRIAELQRELSALQARAGAAEKDAARYRWLRDNQVRAIPTDQRPPESFVAVVGHGFLIGASLDAAIDRAIAEERET